MKTNPKSKKKTGLAAHQKSLWVVRAGRKGEREEVALQNNIIIIRFGDLDDLSGMQDRDHLKEYYSRVNPKETTHRSRARITQVWNFLKEIKKGDIVAIPLKSEDSIAIGKVVGDYEYKKEYGDNGRHTRSVEGFEKIPKSEFDSSSIKAFGRPPTIYEIEGVAKDRIITILLGHQKYRTW